MKDGGMVSLSDTFFGLTWHNQGLFLKHSPLCFCGPIFEDIGCGTLQALLYRKHYSYMKMQQHCLEMQITKTNI